MKTLLVNKSTDDTADNNLSSNIIIFFTENNIYYFPKYSLWGSNPHTIISTGF